MARQSEHAPTPKSLYFLSTEQLVLDGTSLLPLWGRPFCWFHHLRYPHNPVVTLPSTSARGITPLSCLRSLSLSGWGGWPHARSSTCFSCDIKIKEHSKRLKVHRPLHTHIYVLTMAQSVHCDITASGVDVEAHATTYMHKTRVLAYMWQQF